MKDVITDDKIIEKLLTRGVENVYPSTNFLRELLLSGKRLRIYNGIDPTGPSLHLGHAIQLRKLKQFQDLGHEIVLLIGDFTAMIGDPTDKMATRVALTREQVLDNARLYKEQASHFIKFDGENPASITHNSDWLAKMSFADTINLSSKVTYAQTIKRDMFQQRIKEDKDLYLHEFLYPLLQGYDSVAMDVDGEIGGNDQTFNMLMGRDLMKKMKNKEKFVITTKLLTDSIGKKMGKTEGNMVTLMDSPTEMYGKIMRWTDAMILPGLELCTDLSLEEVNKTREEINAGNNPKEAKMKLAREILKTYYDEKAVEEAEGNFTKTFSEGGVPEDVAEAEAKEGMRLKELLAENDLIKSASDFRRLIEEKAISLDGEKITDPNYTVIKDGVIKVGKKRFLKVVIK
ncbi:MAG: tyrosine--tRNA ligase [Patescibacteria group bacterium]